MPKISERYKVKVASYLRTFLLVGCVLLVLQPVTGTIPQQAPAPRDGQHDFDFEIGTWNTHLSRLVHPLTGSTTWAEYDGTSVVSKIWDGRANLVELEVTGPAGHIEALSLRLYDPQAHQWGLNAASARVGTLSVPTVGEFKNGRGEFYDQESFNGRTILVRNLWLDITTNSCRFEQAFSDDGGKTWETNWIALDTRTSAPHAEDSRSNTTRETINRSQHWGAGD
ncbi:MAG TPA: hypothetical protein VIH97_12335 [Candidatus Acidoferrales bacterium]|jgi:hypothetical protein